MPRNGGMPAVHPVADQVEQFIIQGKPDEAKTAIAAALAQTPHHPDLLAAEGLLFAYLGEEDRAIEDLGKAGFVPRARKLAKVLTEHLICRQQMSAKTGRRDGVAHIYLSKVRLAADRPLDHVGIKLTACLIVKNESKNLARCLDSIKSIVDEIVVVDTGSTDNTIEIAKSYGAIIGHFDWCDDFAAARNKSLELATGEWVLWIDADEELTPESAEAIHRGIVRPHFGGFAIEIVNYTDDKSTNLQYVHKPVRLFRRVDGIKFTGKIHEQVMPAIAEKGLPWAHLPGVTLLHYGYRPTDMLEKGKVDRTVGLLIKELEARPDDAFQWFNLANAYTAANDFVGAEKAASQCAKHLTSEDHVGALNYQLWSNALLKLSRPGEAAKVCDNADRLGYGGILNEFERANAFLALGLLEEGLEAANRCLALDWSKDMTGDVGIADFKRFIVRGQLLALLKQLPEAIAMFDRALQANPTYGPAIYSRAATFEKMGEMERSLEGFLSGQENDAVGQLCLKGAARVCMTLGLPKRASDLYREAWRRDVQDEDSWVGWIQAADAYGDMPELVEAYSAYAEFNQPTGDMLINWGRALDASGDVDRAMACYREAMQREPHNANAYFNCGDLYYKLEVFDQAADAYQQGLQREPNNASGWFVLGNSLARLGVIEGARVGYEQALRLRPDYPEALHNLETVCDRAA